MHCKHLWGAWSEWRIVNSDLQQTRERKCSKCQRLAVRSRYRVADTQWETAQFTTRTAYAGAVAYCDAVSDGDTTDGAQTPSPRPAGRP